MTLRYGSLFSGYGGLEMGVQSVLGGTTAWFCEFDKAPSKILAHHWPDVPNLGDITTVDWATVEPVDVLTGGFPCQDVSHAGRRAGLIRDGEGRTRSGLWGHMLRAIDELRPSLVVAENVRGLLSAQADWSGGERRELCLCGGTDRRRGVHPPRREEGHLPSAGDYRHDGDGSAPAGEPAGGVGRVAVPAAPGDGSVAGGVDVEHPGRASGSTAGGRGSVPTAQGRAGAPGAGRGDGAPRAAKASERLGVVDLGGADEVRGDQAADARTEPQGAWNQVCDDCGGWLDGEQAATGEVEPCPWCMGDGDGEPAVRALGAVLADLADVGYDAAWYGLRAADVGAAHGRFRVFIFAWPADADGDGFQGIGRVGTEQRDADGLHRAGQAAADLTLLPTPQTGYTGTSVEAWRERRPAGNGATRETVGDLRLVVEHLLPTPAVNDMGASYTPEEWDAWTAAMQAKHGNGNGHGKSLSIEAQRLLPTPTSRDHKGRNQRNDESCLTGALLPTPMVGSTSPAAHGQISGDYRARMADALASWGDYAPAIARWERVIGRPAPAPTEPGKNGNPRLSPAFVEWLMGLPAGHVTDPAIGLTRNEQLKALGNGVVPQQAAAATRALVEDMARAVVA